MLYPFVFSDAVKNVHRVITLINEVNRTKETIDDAVASTSQEQHLMIKMEESIDIKHEPLVGDDEYISLALVSFHPDY
jgi:hypothetical protein